MVMRADITGFEASDWPLYPDAGNEKETDETGELFCFCPSLTKYFLTGLIGLLPYAPILG